MKIFIVEDDCNLNTILTNSLMSIGYEVLDFTDGKDAFENIDSSIDVYLIDINIPNINGFELVKRIKSLYENTQIFIISGDTNINTILSAYSLGCDDFIKKPFDIREVAAKIDRIVSKSSELIQISKNCYYDRNTKCIQSSGLSIHLTNKEALLFTILIINIGNTVSNDEIENFVWGELVGNGYIRQLVSKLRKTLPCDIIKNHAAIGYRIDKYANN